MWKPESRINVYDFLQKSENPEIRPTAKQEEIDEFIFAEMSSTGNQEENGNCGNQNQR